GPAAESRCLRPSKLPQGARGDSRRDAPLPRTRRPGGSRSTRQGLVPPAPRRRPPFRVTSLPPPCLKKHRAGCTIEPAQTACWLRVAVRDGNPRLAAACPVLLGFPACVLVLPLVVEYGILARSPRDFLLLPGAEVMGFEEFLCPMTWLVPFLGVVII